MLMNSDKKINGFKNTSLLIVLGLLAFSIFMATDSLSEETLDSPHSILEAKSLY